MKSNDTLIVSPVHWEASHNNAMITAFDGMLNVDESVIKDYFDLTAQFFANLGMQLSYQTKTKWILSGDNIPPIKSCSPEKILHQSLLPAFKAMDENGFWPARITEIQMLFKSHAETSGKADNINGVWIWDESSIIKRWLKCLMNWNFSKG